MGPWAQPMGPLVRRRKNILGHDGVATLWRCEFAFVVKFIYGDGAGVLELSYTGGAWAQYINGSVENGILDPEPGGEGPVRTKSLGAHGPNYMFF